MRWIDRGPEPATVDDYARQFTPGWVNHFPKGKKPVGGRPTDSYWGDYRSTLGAQSGNICWYCERKCGADAPVGSAAPTVDHFRPLRWFPDLAYAWSNWVFSCDRCNQNKGHGWPETGYVDPCAAAIAERPEQYFEFDAGDIVAKKGLSEAARRKAWATIDDLRLNNPVLKGYRERKLAQFWKEFKDRPAAEIAARLDEPGEFAGVFGLFVEYLSKRGRL